MTDMPGSSEAKTIENLHDDVLIEVFSYLDVGNLKNSSLACKRWNSVIGSSSKLMKKFKLKIDAFDDLCSDNQSHRRYQSVEIKNISFEKAAVMMKHFDVSQVRHFQHSCGIIRGRIFLEFLSRTPKLESLNMHNGRVFVRNSEIDQCSPVRLAKLRKISLKPATSNFYDFLQVENVEDYDCAMVGGESLVVRVDFGTVARFIKSQTKLTTLAIDSKAFDWLFKDESFRQLGCRLSNLSFQCTSKEYVDDSTLHNNFAEFLESQAPTLTTLKAHLDGDHLPKIVVAAVFNNLPNLSLLRFNNETYQFIGDDGFYRNLRTIESLKELLFRGHFLDGRNQKDFFGKLPELQTLIVDKYTPEIHKTAALLNRKLLNLTIDSTILDPSGSSFDCLRYLNVTNFGKCSRDLKDVQVMITNNPTLDTVELSSIDLKFFTGSGVAEALRAEHLRHLKLSGPVASLKQIFVDLQADYKNLETLLMTPDDSELRPATFRFPKDPQDWRSELRELPERWKYVRIDEKPIQEPTQRKPFVMKVRVSKRNRSSSM